LCVIKLEEFFIFIFSLMVSRTKQESSTRKKFDILEKV